VIVSGEPIPGDEDSSPVSDSSSDDVTQPRSRRRLGRGYHSRPKTERLTTATPRGQFISHRTRITEFQTVRCSSLIARDHYAVDATAADIVDRKCPVSCTTQPASVVTESGTSYELAVVRGVNTQPTDAATVDQTDGSSFCVIPYRQKYCTWPLDARSTADPLGDDVCTDVFRPSNVNRLQRQDAVDLRPPSTVDIDLLSRPSATSASRSTGNVSVDKPEVTLKPPTPLLQHQEQQHVMETESVSQAERSGHIPVSTSAVNETSTFGAVTRSLPRMTVTAFWNFVMSRYGRSDPRTEAERLRRKQQKKKENRARKALRTITIILGAFVLCWTPWH